MLMNELSPFAAFVAGDEPDPSGAFGITYSRFLNAEQAIDVSMSLGLSRIVDSPGDEETGFSVGFGGGTDLPLSPRVALRFDARLFTTIAFSSGEIFCDQEHCSSFSTASTFFQFAGSAGLVFKF